MNNETFLTEKDIDDGKRINDIYETLSPEAKLQAQAYLSALRDKEDAESEKKAG